MVPPLTLVEPWPCVDLEFCSLCKFLGGLYEPGHWLPLETGERKCLPSRKPHPSARKEEGHVMDGGSRGMGQL